MTSTAGPNGKRGSERLRALLVAEVSVSHLLGRWPGDWHLLSEQGELPEQWFSPEGALCVLRDSSSAQVLEVTGSQPMPAGEYDSVDVLARRFYDGEGNALLTDVEQALSGVRPDRLPPELDDRVLERIAAKLDVKVAEGALSPGKAGGSAPSALVAVSTEACHPIDWVDLFNRFKTEPKWLCEPLLEAGRLVSLYSPAKTGKSLLALELAAGLAVGRPVMGNAARPPMSVLYVDKENSEDDILERLRDLGYGSEDLGNLHYLSFPMFPLLDTEQGGRTLLKQAQHYEADLVILDTLSRFFQGEENSNDTFRAVYNHSLMPLKAAGITVLRLDHTGKDEDAGQRGASAKNDDVDAVWHLKRLGQGRFRLHRTHSRTNHGVNELEIVRRTGALRHEIVEATSSITGSRVADPSIEDLAEMADNLNLPREAGRGTIQQAFEAAGLDISKNMATQVARARKAAPPSLMDGDAQTNSTKGGPATREPHRVVDLPACPTPTDRGGQGNRAAVGPDLPACPPMANAGGQGSRGLVESDAPVCPRPNTMGGQGIRPASQQAPDEARAELPSWLADIYELLDGAPS